MLPENDCVVTSTKRLLKASLLYNEDCEIIKTIGQFLLCAPNFSSSSNVSVTIRINSFANVSIFLEEFNIWADYFDVMLQIKTINIL